MSTRPGGNISTSAPIRRRQSFNWAAQSALVVVQRNVYSDRLRQQPPQPPNPCNQRHRQRLKGQFYPNSDEVMNLKKGSTHVHGGVHPTE